MFVVYNMLYVLPDVVVPRRDGGFTPMPPTNDVDAGLNEKKRIQQQCPPLERAL